MPKIIMIYGRLYKNKYINRFFSSNFVEGFFFSALCATIVSFTIFHWILEPNYKYKVVNTNTTFDLWWAFAVVLIVSTYYLFRKRSVKFDFALLILCQVLLLVGVLDYHFQDYVPVQYAYIIPTSYIIGKLAVENCNPKRICVLYFVIAAPMYFISFLDFRMAWKWLWEWGTEMWPPYFTWWQEISRTTFEYGFFLTSCCICYALHIFKKNKALLVIILAADAWIVWFGVKSEGRENACVIIISLLLFVVMKLYDNWKTVNKKIFVFACVIFIFILLIIINSSVFINWYKNSYWSGGGGIFENERIKIDLAAIKNMLAYPLENYTEKYGYKYSHSLALEYGRVYDLTIFVLIELFKLFTFYYAYKMFTNKKSEIKYLLIPAFCCLNIYYFVEPNGYAYRYFWIPGLFISGMIKSCIDKEEERG